MAELVRKVQYIFDKECNCQEILERVVNYDPDKVIQELVESGLRGRGGAGFLTGIKWRLAKEEQAFPKYVICNADEGEPGTFKDRKILEEVASKVFAGMFICGFTIGAHEGIIYLRGEYAYMKEDLEKQIEEFTENVLKSFNYNFKISVFLGAGAYVCGEETALIESLEGERGEPRNKPPFPVTNGLFGKPTVVNNVETFASVLTVFRLGAQEYKKLGTRDQRGSKLICVSGDTPKSGVYEIELGMKISDFVKEFGDGDTKAVLIGGYSGKCIPEKKFEKTVVGEGRPSGAAILLLNHKRSMYRVLHNILDFFAEESCGQCTPCRIGYQQLLKGIEAVKKGEKPSEYLDSLMDLTETMRITSKCGLGQSAPNFFKSIIENYREEIIY